MAPGYVGKGLRYIRLLREAGIVETRREGKQIFYRLTAQKAARLVEALYAIFCADGAEA